MKYLCSLFTVHKLVNVCLLSSRRNISRFTFANEYHVSFILSPSYTCDTLLIEYTVLLLDEEPHDVCLSQSNPSQEYLSFIMKQGSSQFSVELFHAFQNDKNCFASVRLHGPLYTQVIVNPSRGTA